MIEVKNDKVELAVEVAHRGIGDLISLLGDEDSYTVRKASLALLGLGGEAVVGPLSAALPGARSPRHRLAIAGTLIRLGEEFMPQVAAALSEAHDSEKDPRVAAAIRAALVKLTASTPPRRLHPTGRS
jgi:HEAT repeat protein